MKNLIIAYHTYLFGNDYVPLITEQFRLLISSGLFNASSKLYIGVVESPNCSPKNGVEWMQYFWKDICNSKKIEIVKYEVNNEEADTMKWIRDYAKDNPDDYILYFHTKGISRKNDATEDWRHYMEYFNIEKWKDCVAKLDEGYDCCGVLYNTDTPIGVHPHFSGTFWWATGKYINTLNHSYLDSPSRYDREFWIGTGKNPNVFEFHNSGLNSKERLIRKQGHHHVRYSRANYEFYTERVLHVICTAYERPINLHILINCFLLQTNPNWILHIIHDGKPSKEIKDVIAFYNDARIDFTYTPKRNQNYGHPNRKLMLEQMVETKSNFVLITNDDNYYVPVFVEWMMQKTNGATGIVYCNTVHSLAAYELHRSVLRERGIDMGAFIVRMDIAKQVGFTGIHQSADGAYAAECKRISDNRGLEIVKIDKPLFVHN